MTYEKNYSGSTGSGATGTGSGATGSFGRTGSYGSGQSYGTNPSYGSGSGTGSSYGPSGYGGYESWGSSYGGSEAGGSRMMLGLLIGAAVGAAVALLVAPTTGREARENLGRWARDARSRATNMAGQVRDRFSSGPNPDPSAGNEFVGGTAGASSSSHLNEDREIPEL